MPKYSFQRAEPLSPEEVRSMIEAADTIPLKALLAFLYLYGVRIGEALSLSKGDFKPLKHGLKVNISVEKKRQTGPIAWKHPLEVIQSDSNAYFMDKISAWLAVIDAPERKVWKMNRKTAWRKIHRLNPQCSPHIFRHTRNRRLVARGADALVLMDWNGWSDPRPAANYLGLSGNTAKRFSKKVD